MRFNGRELAYLAQNPRHEIDMEGVLQVREKTSGLFRYSEVYVERLFRLRGNLLFYFKTKDPGSEPLGVYVMERCVVELDVEEDQPFSFVIVFEGDTDAVIRLVAQCELSRDAWIARLHIASYECMQIQLCSLRERLRAHTGGRDPAATPSPPPPSGRPAGNDVSQRIDNGEPVLEMSISCAGLPLEMSDRHPTTYISVQTLCPPQQQWQQYKHTEVIEHSSNPVSLATVTFSDPALVSPITRLKMTVNNVKERMTNTVTPIGSVIFTIADLLSAPGCKLCLQLTTTEQKEVGQLTVTAWHDGKHLNWEEIDGNVSMRPCLSVCARGMRPASLGFTLLHPLYDNIVSRSYRFPAADGQRCNDIVVQEYMGESRLTFELPKQLLSLWIEEEQRKTEELQALGALVGELDDVRSEMMDFRLSSISTYTQHMSYLASYTGAPFKPSCQKEQREVEFAPTNLHIQRMSVQAGQQSSVCYDTVTVGAFTALAQRHRGGGLRRLLRQQAADCGVRSQVGSRLIGRLGALCGAAHGYCECLCRAAMEGDGATLNNTAAELADRIRQLIEVSESPVIEEAMAGYQGARAPPAVGGGGGGGGAASPAHDSWTWSGTDFVRTSSDEPWDLLRANTEASLVCVLAKVEALLRDHQGEPTCWLDELSGQVIKLRSCVNVLCGRAKAAITYLSIQACQGRVDLTHQIKYRRDVVFAQALTSAVTGFVTKLAASLTDVVFLRQLFQLGVLLQFESLLSCQGGEVAMVEDMAVGVCDLGRVVFRLKRAADPHDTGPRVTGDRTGYTVDVPLADASFQLLPRELQNGHVIKVVPVMFSVGINEKATIAERLGRTVLQDEVNSESYERLHAYHEKYIDIVGERPECSGVNKCTPTGELMRSLHINVKSNKSKNVDILHLAAQVCRALDGVRFTSCKSAKDRTAMGVTLESVQLLQRHHGLPSHTAAHALECMRSEGVRRMNTLKNSGQPKYAFNSIQLLSLPRLYRPPGGTYSSGKT